MKSTAVFALLATAAAIFLSGCGKTPEACFSVADTLVDQNEPVVFSNCSIYQDKGYLWDFGDGSTSDSPGATHTFTSQGEFLVRLTSFGKTSATDDSYSQIIKVGQRKLFSVSVSSLPSVDGNGNPWDPTDPADVVVIMAQNGTVLFQSAVNTDLALAAPYIISVAGDVNLAPDMWTFAIMDDDGTSMDTMATYNLDLNTYIPNEQKQIEDLSATADWIINYSIE